MLKGTDEQICLTCGRTVSSEEVCLVCGQCLTSKVLGSDGLPARSQVNSVADDEWYLASMLEVELELVA